MIFRNLFEKRSTLAQPDQWLIDIFDGGVTTSGETITPLNSLEIATVYACINIKANAVAKLPFQVFKRTKDGRIREKNHNVVRLIEKRPNPYQTPFLFKHTLCVHQNLWGNAYIWMEFKGKRIENLWILDPSQTEIYVDEKGRIWFLTKIRDKNYKLHYDEVIHLPYLTPDGIAGKSPIQVARETLGIMKASQKFIGSFYKNGTLSSGIIKTKHQLGKDAKDKLRAAWISANSGIDNAMKVAILDSGLEYQPINTMPLQDAEFIATQKFNVAEIAKIFNVPLHKLAELDRATFSNIEQQSMDFIQDCIQPIVIAWEEEFNYKLFSEREQGKYYVKANLTSALRGDSESRAKYYKDMIQLGVYSINEVRELEEKDSIGELGDKHFVSLNYVPLDKMEDYQMAKVGKGGEGSGEKGN
ncbi:phage portal protein [Caloranaerobacter ferrireducens]|uniref:phage portal protein n=1 Tax=Caloranaerobacter ferrireducens TaxID=1323370 RepID=UPI00084D6A19|nr:phage portal protein [Caloranaerobacter ferrireducens]